ncbi:MAG: UpxY family transcription antiterminator, partial [Gillisia sp.]|nr:UpxY family transcription antiterminator [Gillisia sp.]
CRSRNEKKIAITLEKMGIEVYCPMVSEVRQWSDRKKKVDTPLFTSYVFVKLKEKERDQVFQVTGVVRYLFWLGKPAIVKEEEILTIRKWVGDDNVLEIAVADFSPGDRMTIPKGVFKDQEVLIKEVGKNKMRLVLLGLGCTVTVKIRDVV